MPLLPYSGMLDPAGWSCWSAWRCTSGAACCCEPRPPPVGAFPREGSSGVRH
ncbi:hypothetical protein QJS66_21395 [Kocuria rhizophila]|nr:hypothetical protein QJS66_21395 [Kocuria rhizophila]